MHYKLLQNFLQSFNNAAALLVELGLSCTNYISHFKFGKLPNELKKCIRILMSIFSLNE